VFSTITGWPSDVLIRSPMMRPTVSVGPPSTLAVFRLIKDQLAFRRLLNRQIGNLMEPQRPLVDRKVLEFVQGHTFHPADFIIRSDGVCRLNSEMTRRIACTIALGDGT
jgi:hypothetical protein